MIDIAKGSILDTNILTEKRTKINQIDYEIGLLTKQKNEIKEEVEGILNYPNRLKPWRKEVTYPAGTNPERPVERRKYTIWRAPDLRDGIRDHDIIRSLRLQKLFSYDEAMANMNYILKSVGDTDNPIQRNVVDRQIVMFFENPEMGEYSMQYISIFWEDGGLDSRQGTIVGDHIARKGNVYVLAPYNESLIK